MEKPSVFLSVEDKQQQFKTDIKALLLKYKAELTIENFGRNWSDDYKLVVDFEWDKDLCDRTDNGSVPQWVIGNFEDGQ